MKALGNSLFHMEFIQAQFAETASKRSGATSYEDRHPIQVYIWQQIIFTHSKGSLSEKIKLRIS